MRSPFNPSAPTNPSSTLRQGRPALKTLSSRSAFEFPHGRDVSAILSKTRQRKRPRSDPNNDKVALNEWQAVGTVEEIISGKRRNTRLLGQDIIVEMDGEIPRMFENNANGGIGTEHPAKALYGHIWTTLGTPVKAP